MPVGGLLARLLPPGIDSEDRVPYGCTHHANRATHRTSHDARPQAKQTHRAAHPFPSVSQWKHRHQLLPFAGNTGLTWLRSISSARGSGVTGRDTNSKQGFYSRLRTTKKRGTLILVPRTGDSTWPLKVRPRTIYVHGGSRQAKTRIRTTNRFPLAWEIEQSDQKPNAIGCPFLH